MIEVVSPEPGAYEYSVFDMTGKDKPEFPVFETDDVGFVSYEVAVNDAKSWIRDFLSDYDRAVEHIEKLYATKKALSSSTSVETMGSVLPKLAVLPKLTADVFNRPDCPEWANYAAVNKDGSIHVFEFPPKIVRAECWNTQLPFQLMEVLLAKFDPSDWQNSLVERPVKETKFPEWCKVDAVGWHKRCGYFKVTYIDDVSKRVDIQQAGDKSRGYLSFHTVCKETTRARLRPYNEAEMRGLVGKTINNASCALLVIAYSSLKHAIKINELWRTADQLFSGDGTSSGYTVDGKPCCVFEHLNDAGEWVE